MNNFTVSLGGLFGYYDARFFGARKQGPFIIHRTVRAHHTGWTILHRETGYTVAFNFPTRASARNCARELTGIVGERWNFQEPEQWAHVITALDREVMAYTIREYCGAVYRSLAPCS